jgi:hypothetical protein
MQYGVNRLPVCACDVDDFAHPPLKRLDLWDSGAAPQTDRRRLVGVGCSRATASASYRIIYGAASGFTQ